MSYFIFLLNMFSLLLNCLPVDLHTNNGTLQKGQICMTESNQTVGCCLKFNYCLSAIAGELPNITRCSEDNIICCPGPCISIIEENSDSFTAERISEFKCLEYLDNAQSDFEFNINKNNSNDDFATATDSGNQDHNHIQTGLITPNATETIIVGGNNSEIFEFPHMAAIGWYLVNGNLTFKCGGALISERFVLTAGHCTSSPNSELRQPAPSIVRLREQNLLNDDEEKKSPIDIPIKKIIKHPNYKPPKKYYDIALIELKESVQFSSDVFPACLWTKDSLGDYTEATITGWGTTESGKKENSAILQKAYVEFIDDAVCDNLYKRYHNRHWNGLKDHQLCAGVLQGGIDSCQGDSGGPLQVENYIKHKIFYSVVGVTSFGRSCAKPDQPGIYTKISKFLDWIEPIVWNESDNN